MGSVRQFKPFTHSSKKYRVFSDNITTTNCLNANFLRSPLAYDSVPFIYAHVLEISSQGTRQILGELNRRSARSILFMVMVGLYDFDIKPVTQGSGHIFHHLEHQIYAHAHVGRLNTRYFTGQRPYGLHLLSRVAQMPHGE
jgi:hypothetical protein